MLSSILLYAVAVAAFLYLVRTLFRRRYLEFDDDIETVFVVPGLSRPPPVPTHAASLLGMPKYGPVFRVVNMLRPSMATVTVGDPMLLREMLVGKSWPKFQRGDPRSPYSEGFISAENGQLWRDVRAAFEATFTNLSVRRHVPVMEEQTAILLERLAKASAENPAGFDLVGFFHRYSFDVVTRLVFGAEVKAQTSAEGASYAKTFDSWQSHTIRVTTGKLLLGSWGTYLLRKVIAAQKADGDRMWALLDSERERIARGEARESIMDDAYSRSEAGKLGAEVSPADLRKALMSLLFAGHDTTTSTLSFLFYELSKRPDLQDTIRSEAAGALASHLPNLDELEKCRTLNACIRETLRRYPAAPFGTGRVMFEDLDFSYTDFSGKPRRIRLRKGDRVMPYFYGVQNSAAYWDEPLAWKPERFADDPTGGAKTGSMFAYAPFGNGARRCIGEKLALAEIRLCTASLLSRFEVEHKRSW
ncbi:cytochrome P450 [Hyaloraphidium curvatum]|nr:cytochrome P450 [Hyaloraphidium curvatum]